jgi:hypothetical protein
MKSLVVRLLVGCVVLSGVACGSDGGDSTNGGQADAGDASSAADAGHGTRPHPLYAALDLDTLPGAGGAAVGPYEAPSLPAMTVSAMGDAARAEIQAGCQASGAAVTVPDRAGDIGTLDIGNVDDCDITLGPNVIIRLLYLGHMPGPTVAPVHRIRVRGGQIGSVMVDPGSSDLVLDGVTINSGIVPAAERAGVAIYLMDNGAGEHVNRFAVVGSVIRMVATLPSGPGDTDGSAYLAANAQNVFFANNNIVTAGNRNAWGFRIGGGNNFIAVDNVVRVSFHKLIRMNDGPVDYVYVKGGTWMREATLTAGGLELNDAFAQLGDLGTDHVYIHDTSVYFLSAQPVSFGATAGPGQNGKSWEARRIAWHAVSSSVISDAHLTALASGCVAGAICDYGIGTHTYEYDAALMFPANPWRVLPALAEDDPMAL